MRCLAQASPAVRHHRQTGWAALADDVPSAADQCAQLLVERRCAAAPCVKASRGAATGICTAAECPQARVGTRATMLYSCRCYIQHPCVWLFRAQPFLPLLLVAAVLQRYVKRPHARQCAAADCHVRAPRIAGVGVARAELERGDGGRLAPAGTRTPPTAAFQTSGNGPGEHIYLWEFGGCLQQCR